MRRSILCRNLSVKSEIAEEPQTEQHTVGSPAEQPALALSANDFSALEERILRTIELVKRERQARTAAEERAAKAEAQLTEQDSSRRSTEAGDALPARGARSGTAAR